MPDTVEGLKERRAWLLRQVELTNREIEKLLKKAARPPRPTPQELPGVPPAASRKPSVHEENYAEFQNSRRKRLEHLGVAAVDDEPMQAAFINVIMKRIRDACGGDADERADDRLWLLFDAYLLEAWAAKLTPPYPFRAFAAEKTWRRLLDEKNAVSWEAH